MEYPLTANDYNYSSNDNSTETKDVNYRKHDLGELIFSMEKSIRESQNILEKIKTVYYQL